MLSMYFPLCNDIFIFLLSTSQISIQVPGTVFHFHNIATTSTASTTFTTISTNKMKSKICLSLDFHHKIPYTGGLNSIYLSSQVWGQGANMAKFWGKSSSWFVDSCPLMVSSHDLFFCEILEREQVLWWSLPIRSLILSWWPHPYDLIWF